MKNFFKKVTALIFVLLFIFSVPGCSLILDIENNINDYTGGNYTSEIIADIKLDKNLIFCDTHNNEAQPTVNNVIFKSNEKTEDFARFEDAAATVNRSIVKVIMEDATGNALSYGSGVIVDIEGGLGLGEYYVLTCHHVVASEGNISICVPDEKARNHGDVNYNQNYIFKGYIGGQKIFNPLQNKEVSLVGGDRDSDVAVLKLSSFGKNVGALQKATFPHADDELRYAQDVFSIGNSTGDLPMTFLSGNISYLDRTVAIDSIGYMNLIQHDCLITHGNSGGGLFNMKGQLIGITNAGSDVYKGMNYAIPYYGENGFMAIAEKLIKSNTATNYGYIEDRWNLGVTIQEAEQKVNGSAVIVVSVDQNSNANELIKTGDYILKVEFAIGSTQHVEQITSLNTFKNAIFIARQYLSIGDTVKITVARANG